MDPVRPEPPAEPTRRARPVLLRSLLAVLFFTALLLFLRESGVSHYFTREHIRHLDAAIDSFGPWGPVLYVLFCIVACALFCPAIPLILLGSFFGAVRGTILATIGLTLGAAVSFLLSRYALRPFIEHLTRTSPAFRKIDDGVKQQGWRMVMITRMVPVFPYNVQNFAYGLTGLRFGTYVLTSALCMIPPVAAYVFAAGSLISGGGELHKTLMYLGVGAILFVLLSYIPVVLRKRFGDEARVDKPAG